MEEKEKNISPKEKYIWTFKIIFALAIAGLVYLNFMPLIAGAVLFLFFVANAALLASLIHDFKKGREIIGAETEKKSKELLEFDKITRQLVKRELEVARANQRLAELDAAKSDFISVAAHQLRTPLTGIKWSYAALLEPDTGPLNADQKEIVEKGLTSITNTIDLINDLLNVAHLEEGKLEFEIKKQSIIPIAEKAVAGIKLIADEKKISVFSNRSRRIRVSRHEYRR